MSADALDAQSSPSWRDRLRYRSDLLLARGIWVPLLLLGAVTLAATLLSTLLLAAFDVTLGGSADGSVLEDFWQSVLRVLDSGTMASDVGWGRRVLALVITIVGLLIAGTLIGFIASGVEQRVERLQAGRSAVIESGHVVILGASSGLPVVVEQLVLANAKRRSNAIVVLDEGDPTRVSEEVRTVVGDPRGSRLVFRRGDPTRQSELATVALRDARTVIVLADDVSADAGGDSDARVVTAVLAAGAELGGFDRVPIIAELHDPATAASLQRACGGMVHPVVAVESVSLAAAFALREPGLNQVIAKLLDFDGSDLYLSEVSGLHGMAFRDIVYRYANARPIGRMGAEGDVEINPDPETVFDESDRLIVIAHSDVDLEVATGQFRDRADPGEPATSVTLQGPREQHVLVIGWNMLGARLLAQWEQYAAPGSTVEIVYDPGRVDAGELDIDPLPGLDVTLTPTARSTWHLGDLSHVAGLTTILMLGYRGASSPAEADSHTLLNLMLLRRLLDDRDGPAPSVVVELHDLDNVDLARRAGADDYVVSDAIGSRLIAQLAQQPERRSVFLSLYAGEGPSVHLVDAHDLGLVGTVRGADIVSAAYAAGVVAIGWRRRAALDGELGLNPHVSDRVHLDPDDQIVIVG